MGFPTAFWSIFDGFSVAMLVKCLLGNFTGQAVKNLDITSQNGGFSPAKKMGVQPPTQRQSFVRAYGFPRGRRVQEVTM